ncbi:hypothetical protein DAT35_00375 [Vitiosangium sp. GDMCC 1.1324]|nr:hypothetical protein DAT35_00375 [Vitiosangium sp. GDMCC 1.1324]
MGAGPARRPGEQSRLPRYLRSEAAGEIDLSKGRVDPAAIAPDSEGKVTARLPGLAVGELELEETADGYKTRGEGAALPLTVGPLAGVLGDSLVLVVRIENNVITGRAAVGSPGRAVPKGDSALFRAIEKSPEALGWAGLSKVSVGSKVNALEGGSLKLGAESLRFTLGGFVEGSGSFSVEGDRVSFSGSAEVKLPGASTGKLEVIYSPETGLSGEAHLQVGVGKVSGGVDARLRRGVLDIQGTAGYAGDRLKGSITLVATDEQTAREITRKPPQAGELPGQDGAGAAGGPAVGAGPEATPIAAKPGPRALCGWGELDFSLTEWLTGKAKVVVNSQGEATVQGEIAPPQELILFEQKEWTKSLLKLEVRAAYGLPVVGNVFVFANVGLEALATIGPGKLYNIKLSGQYSTDKQVDQELNLQATLNISAFAGLRLRAEGGVGVELLGHDIKAGVGVWALAGVRGYVEATPTIGYRQKAGAEGEFYIQGHMELAAQPFLGLGGDLFVEVDSPWWSPLPDDKWTWPLGSLEYPLPGEFGIGADVEHVLGSKQWPEVKFTEVEFDGGRFMSDLLSQSAPGKSKGGEDHKPAKWDEGGASGSPAGGKPGGNKDASPAKAPGPGGKKGGKTDASAGQPHRKGDGGKPGKAGKDKSIKDKPGKEEATGAPGQVGEPVRFDAKGESYRLWVQVKGKSATLLIAAPQQGAASWIASQERKVGGNHPKQEQQKAHGLGGEARALASTIDQHADRVASGKGDKAALQQADAQLKKDEHRLVGMLRQLAELSGGEKGELSVGEPVSFTGGREAHRMYFVVKGGDAVLLVASTPTPLGTRLDDFAHRLEGSHAGGEGVGYFSDYHTRNRARELLSKARALSTGLNGDADALVREHREKMDKASAAETAKILAEERSLASILSELYEMFGEHVGDAEFTLRARYAGAAGAGELSVERSSQGKTAYVMGSGPIFGLVPGANRGLVTEEMAALRKQFEAQGDAQTILPPPKGVEDRMDVLGQKADAAEKTLSGHLQGRSKSTREAAVSETTQHLQEAAAAAGQVASVKRVGAGELVERAVTLLADEKRAEVEKLGWKGKTVFDISTEIRHQIEKDAATVELRDAELKAEHEAKLAQQQASVTQQPEAEKDKGPFRSKRSSRFSASQGPFETEKNTRSRTPVKKEYTPAFVSSFRGTLVSAQGTYEEIRVVLAKAKDSFAAELLQALHQNQVLLRLPSKERKENEFLLSEEQDEAGRVKKRYKDQNQLVAEVRLLFHVEMTRAAAAWAFGVSGFLNAANAQQAADAFKTDVYPHAIEGFMEAYRKHGAALFDGAAKKLFEELGVKFQKESQLDKGKHVFLAPAQLHTAVKVIEDKLAEMYESSHSRKGTT